jgi:phosphohistidine phosphatase SixA
MRLFVVRHAVAVAKHSWTGSDQQRPLTESGEQEAAAIAQWFDDAPTVIVSSPTVRCFASVLPLAHRFELDLLTRGELLPNNPAPAAELVRSFISRGIEAVVCTHGEVIPALLRTLQVIQTSHPLDQCVKGSIWELEPFPDGIHATYHELPERRTRPAVMFPRTAGAMLTHH